MASLASAIGFAASQVNADFTTAACPEGFSLRKGASISAEGLVRRPDSTMLISGGCVSAEPFTYTEAFRFEVEFTTKTYRSEYTPEACVWTICTCAAVRSSRTAVCR